MIKVTAKKMADRFNALVVRERLLLAGALVAALYILFDLIAFGPAQKKANALTANIVTQKKHLDSLKAEETVLAKVLANDPNSRLKKEVDELTAHLSRLDKDIIHMSSGLVPVRQLAVMLQDVLKFSDKLQIQQLSTLVPEKINLNQRKSASPAPKIETIKTEPAAGGGIAELNLYRQGVKLVVQGSYFQILDYIKHLETTPWRFYWDGLSYKVINYPLAEVELQVYTLSVQGGVE